MGNFKLLRFWLLLLFSGEQCFFLFSKLSSLLGSDFKLRWLIRVASPVSDQAFCLWLDCSEPAARMHGSGSVKNVGRENSRIPFLALSLVRLTHCLQWIRFCGYRSLTQPARGLGLSLWTPTLCVCISRAAIVQDKGAEKRIYLKRAPDVTLPVKHGLPTRASSHCPEHSGNCFMCYFQVL